MIRARILILTSLFLLLLCTPTLAESPWNPPGNGSYWVWSTQDGILSSTNNRNHIPPAYEMQAQEHTWVELMERSRDRWTKVMNPTPLQMATATETGYDRLMRLRVRRAVLMDQVEARRVEEAAREEAGYAITQDEMVRFSDSTTRSASVTRWSKDNHIMSVGGLAVRVTGRYDRKVGRMETISINIR